MAHGARTPSCILRRALALAFLTSGCFLGGQTGQENETSTDPCNDATPRPIGIDEATPQGYRPRDILAERASDEHLPFAWYQPERSDTKVRLAFSIDTDDPRWVSSATCPGFVEFDAEIVIATDDAKVQATFRDVLEVSGAQNASFYGTVPVTEVRGTFDANDVIDPRHFAEPKLALRIDITAGEIHGQLFLDGRDPNPNDNASPTSPSLGEF